MPRIGVEERTDSPQDCEPAVARMEGHGSGTPHPAPAGAGSLRLQVVNADGAVRVPHGQAPAVGVKATARTS